MELVALGSTGHRVSRMGLGLAALGRPGYINLGHGDDFLGRRTVEAMRRNAHAVLDHAHRCGVRYFDAARSYGRAEDFLAGWLEKRPDGVVVGSKWGYTYTAEWRTDADVHEVKDHSEAAFERQFVATEALLGDWLALYQIHSATLDTGVLENGALHRRLAELRERSVAVGLSTSGPRQGEAIERALAIEVDGIPLFATVQSTWNVLETSAGPALAAAAAAGCAIIVKEAVANGRLTARNPDLPLPLATHPAPDAVALAAALAQPWVTVVLSGAATLDQVDSNLEAFDVDPTLVASLPDLAEPPAVYWERRAKLPWT